MDVFEVKNWERCKLNIVNKNKEKISVINYFYLRNSKNKLLKNVIDINLSKLDMRKNGEIRSIQNLKLVNKIENDIFLVNDLALLNIIFCSKLFMTNFKEHVWKGIELLPETELGLAKKLWAQ